MTQLEASKPFGSAQLHWFGAGAASHAGIDIGSRRGSPTPGDHPWHFCRVRRALVNPTASERGADREVRWSDGYLRSRR
jgi:hypothetical protein